MASQAPDWWNLGKLSVNTIVLYTTDNGYNFMPYFQGKEKAMDCYGRRRP
ncbi:MAG TPA: hypothetical protein VJ810_23930 [Blastocatellia bacterium]|nr:hypothetical protein [Blastocatellia bacterium]